MKKSDMSNYMREEMWAERVSRTIAGWEKIQGVTVPEDIKATINKFMRTKIEGGVKKGNLMSVFMRVAVTSLIYIKMKRKK